MLKEKQSIPGSDRNLRAGLEERERLQDADWEKSKEKIPEEKEIAGYIIHFGKESKNYTQKLDVGPVYSIPGSGIEQLFHLFLCHPGLHQNEGNERAFERSIGHPERTEGPSFLG